MSPLAIEYPITRTIHWRRLALFSYIGAFVAVIILTLLNVALVGYETVNVFLEDFNSTQHLWYHAFLPYQMSKSQDLCEPHLFSIGDTLKLANGTNHWTLASIESVKTKLSGVVFPYSGNTLDSCDITRIAVQSTSSKLHTVPLLECFDINGYHIRLTTNDRVADIYGGMTSDLLQPLEEQTVSTPVPKKVFGGAADEFLGPLVGKDELYATALLETPCPASSAHENCSQASPSFNATVTATISGSETTRNSKWPPTRLDRDADATLLNLLQTLYAWERIKLNIDSRNNFILHKEAIPTVLVDIKAKSTSFYSKVESGAYGPSPVIAAESGPMSFEAEYYCKYQHLKSPGSLIVSVLVAVLSMFSTGWALYLAVISSVAKRQSHGANLCEGHKDVSYQSLEIATSDVETIIGDHKEKEEWSLAGFERGR